MNKGSFFAATSFSGLLAIGANSTLAQPKTETLQYDPLVLLFSNFNK
jgi:hypothetical protein